jgi:hypothetical protein
VTIGQRRRQSPVATDARGLPCCAFTTRDTGNLLKASSPSARRVQLRVLAAVSLAGLLVAGCGSATVKPRPAAERPSTSATTTPQPAPSGPGPALTVPVPDSHCPGGQGIGINTAEWTSQAAGNGDDYPELAAAMLPNGDTLVVASGDPTPDTAIAAEFRTPCDLDPAFGQNGATQLSASGFALSISAVLPTADGGALIAGGTSAADDGRWVVGKLTAGGQLDQAFGRNGWVRLPWVGSASKLAVARNGDILVGGSGIENGNLFLTEITAQGSVVPTFGTRGRAPLPPSHDGGVEGLWVEPDGNILGLVGGGNMGCWSVGATTLSPAGRPVPGFAARFQHTLNSADPDRQSGLPIFVGGATAGPAGFHLVGTAQDGCVDDPPNHGPNPSQRIIDVAIGYDGRRDAGFGADGVTSFPAPIAEQAWVLPQSDATVMLVISPYRYGSGGHGRDNVLVYRISKTGRLDTSYAKHGVADVPLPYTAGNDPDPWVGPVPVGNGRQAALVTMTADGNAVTLIPIPS